jgi:hypothetical protein
MTDAAVGPLFALESGRSTGRESRESAVVSTESALSTRLYAPFSAECESCMI